MAQNSVSTGPIIVNLKAIINQPFAPQLIGVMQYAFLRSYVSQVAQIELMAEMKRPFDFWKATICAQVKEIGSHSRRV